MLMMLFLLMKMTMKMTMTSATPWLLGVVPLSEIAISCLIGTHLGGVCLLADHDDDDGDGNDEDDGGGNDDRDDDDDETFVSDHLLSPPSESMIC